MKMTVIYNKGWTNITTSGAAIPRKGECITIIGVIRGEVQDVHHIFDPQSGEQVVEIDLRD